MVNGQWSMVNGQRSMIIVITLPEFFEGEAERITQFLEGNVDLIHIRKPGAKREQVEELLLKIPSKLRNRLILHDHFELALQYGLHGIHLNSRNRIVPKDWKGAVSRSCHSIAELAECKKESYDYVSLSPIFDSISKEGYKSAFTREQLEEARHKGIIDNRVVALGGVTFEKIGLITEMGFGGAMILGDAWK